MIPYTLVTVTTACGVLMFVEFVETKKFQNSWTKAGLNEDDLAGLQQQIMNKPEGDGGFKGSGRLKKIRYGRPGRSKREDSRIIYCYFLGLETVVLLFVLEKKDAESVSPAVGKALDQIADEIEKSIKDRRK